MLLNVHETQRPNGVEEQKRLSAQALEPSPKLAGVGALPQFQDKQGIRGAGFEETLDGRDRLRPARTVALDREVVGGTVTAAVVRDRADVCADQAAVCGGGRLPRS
jgi:hypothetical protein